MEVAQFNIIEGEDKIKYDEAKVISDVRVIYSLLVKSQEKEKEDFFNVVVEANYHSRFDPSQMRLVIRPICVGNGYIYAHEASHALRYFMLKEQGFNYNLQDSAVHEFFGRVGEKIVKRLARGTRSEELFSDENNPIVVGYFQLKKFYVDRMLQLRKLIGMIPENYSGERNIFMKRSLRKNIRNLLDHSLADRFAIQYDADYFLSIKGLYAMADSNVRERFFVKNSNV